MVKHKLRWVSISVMLALALQMLPLHFGAARAQTRATAFGHFFPETFQAVGGVFWDYWVANGGLPQQGYPISQQILERSDTDGNEYVVQYFERAVFESHPENEPPFNVLLSQLGTFRYNEKYPNGAPNQQPNTSPGSVLFPETGKRLGGRFLQYWQQNGGLMQQGYPISDEFVEVSDLDGRFYTVQYFERAAFELHPENAPPYDVLLSQLGTFRYAAQYQSNLSGFPGDIDADDIADGDDRCPRSAENVNVVFDGDGCPDTLQTLMIFAAEDINGFWQQVFDEAGELYFPPEDFVAYNEEFETACGPTVPNNAFYCSRAHGIYWHYDFILEQLQTDGDFAPVTILAHEWGHLVQADLGLLDAGLLTIETELMADCFAGAWAAHAGNEGLLEEGDLDEGATSLFRAGDDIELPWFDPRAHGQPDQRVSAFETGLDGGVSACLEE